MASVSVSTHHPISITPSRDSMAFTSTKGLLNGPGQNNCFLNSAVQVSLLALLINVFYYVLLLFITCFKLKAIKYICMIKNK